MVRTTESMNVALGLLGVRPEDRDLRDRLQFTKSGRLRRLLGNNYKCSKGEGRDVLTAVMHLSPSTEAGWNTCPFSTSCASVCIMKTGQLVTNSSLRARISKTLFYKLFREDFLAQLRMELRQHEHLARVKGMLPAVRLNGTSDIVWEKTGVFDEFPGIQAYDYTKVPLERRTPGSNYHLTYSLSEARGSMDRALEYLGAGHNAAVVVQSKDGTTRKESKAASAALVDSGSFMGFPVVSGDEDDIRFWDPKGHWVVLYAKGPAVRDTTGFVQRIG